MKRLPITAVLASALAALLLAAGPAPAAPSQAAAPNREQTTARPMPADPLGLVECIDLARQNSARVARSQGMTDWADAEHKAAFLRMFPRVDLDLKDQPKVDYYGRPVDYHGTLGEGDNVYSTEVKLTQPVYAPEVTRTLEQANTRKKSASLMKESAGLEVALEVVEDYYRLLAAQEKAAVRRGLVDQAGVLVESTRRAYEAGRLLNEDYLEARARLMEATYQEAESASQVREGSARLKVRLGMPEAAKLDLKGQVPKFAPPDDPQALADKAAKDSQYLSKAKAEEKLAAASLALAQSRQSGRLNLVGSYGLEGLDFPGNDKFARVILAYELNWGEFGGSAYYGYEQQYQNDVSFYYQDKELDQRGINLNFLGKKDSPVVEEAEARARRYMAKSDLRARRLELVEQVITLSEEARRAEHQLAAARSAEQLLAERVQVLAAKVEAGRATGADELEGRMDWAKARVKMIEARYQRYQAVARLCLLTGCDLSLADLGQTDLVQADLDAPAAAR